MMENQNAVQAKETRGILQQIGINSYNAYTYHTGGEPIQVMLHPRKTYSKQTDKQGYESYLSPSTYTKRALEEVLVQRKAAFMQCDPPLITSVPGYLAYVPQPPPDCSIKDELIQRQEEFIIECMYPKRILPSNVKLRDDNRPLSPSRIPGIKLTMRDIYGPERSPTSKRGCSFLKRRSPSPIRWRRLRADLRERCRSRSRSRSLIRNSKLRLRSISPFLRSPSPRLRSISPRLKKPSPRASNRLRSAPTCRLRSPSPRLRSKLSPKLRSPTPRNRSPSCRLRSVSPLTRSLLKPRLQVQSPRQRTPSPPLRSPCSQKVPISPRLSPSTHSEKSESSQELNDLQLRQSELSTGVDLQKNQKITDKNKYQRSESGTPSK